VTGGRRLEVLVARQPILDARLEVVGYELLFRRPGDGQHAGVTDAERATSQVIVDAIGELGLERLVGNRRAFVNVSRELLLAVRPLPLPPERVVLEILEEQAIDAELFAVARELVGAGFTLALDDFVYDPALEPLLGLASIVKLDVLALAADAVTEQLSLLRGRDLQLVAEKVETTADFARCRDTGFDLFQGYFYARPELVRGRGIPTDRLGALGTLSALQRAAGSLEQLEEVISRDVTLSYKILRYANSAFVGARTPVGSVRAALMRLGTRTVQQWATVLTLAGIRDAPAELIATGLLRARTCRLLVSDADPERAEGAFMTGLFSVLDALLQAPMDEVLDALPLDAAVSAALLERTGPEGEALAAVLAYEAGVPATGPGAGYDLRAVGAAYHEALAWAQALESELA
jgi:EAL and modified HD-GYP domain-containing signal transduction protein